MYATPNGLVAMGVVFSILGVVFVSLRFYTRYIQKLPFLLDDLFILPATVLMIVSCITLIIGVVGQGLGYPTPGLNGKDPEYYDPSQTILAEKVEFGIITFQPLSLGFTKLSIIFFYRRVFCDRTSKSTFSLLTWLAIALTTLWSLTFFFAWLFSCGIHFDAQWSPVVDLITECVDILQLNEAYAISDFLIDLLILVLPVYPIWKLHMPPARRIAVLLILMLGALAIVASIIRAVIVILLVEHIDSSFVTSDEDLLVSILLYWTVCESGLATLVACLPTYRFLFRKVNFDSIIGSLNSRFQILFPRSSNTHSPNYQSDSQINFTSNTQAQESSPYGTKGTVELKSFIGLGMVRNNNGDLEAALGERPSFSHEILVTSSILQTEKRVGHSDGKA